MNTRNVTAVLGPTNTGKTHLAIERMLGHETGVIGLPLRLLAREVYSRVASRAGKDQVALITGEEKIVPESPRYWVSTVEAMPRQTDATFVAIDEIQIASDLERGHVFTDRILNLRGSQETLILGADTMRGIVEHLLPGVHVVTRPRMSVLAYAGQKKITRLPQRSAVVTFSANDVYAIAELIRRQRGGAAVVLGALSPRTRNKQVEIYQSGDVDFLVATDAIGMGLNLDVDHVAFAADQKFDGHQQRPLTAAELAQVAGRAGRHMRDGTFGVTSRVDPLSDHLVEAIENHHFEPVKMLQWRNDDLSFDSLNALKASLEEPPSVQGLTRSPPVDDQIALDNLSRNDEVRDRLVGSDEVRRLWDVCRLPDYRRIAPAQHAELLGDIFRYVIDNGTISDDWMESHIKRASRTDGDIDTLSSRIAHIRTCTFIANQPDWLADPAHWRGKAHEAEDALSDALHDKLTKRFVDRRTSVLMRRLRESAMLEAEITSDGDVLVEAQHVGQLKGFRFTPDQSADGAEAKAIRAAAQKALAKAIESRADTFSKAKSDDIVLSSDDSIRWRGEPIAKLLAGDDTLKPRFVLLADEHLTGPARDAVAKRLETWLDDHIATLAGPLVSLSKDQTLEGLARGLAFRLVEELGILDRQTVKDDVRALEQSERANLRRHGVRFGAFHIYVPALLKPGPSSLLAQLWQLKNRDEPLKGLLDVAAISSSGRTSVDCDPDIDPMVWQRFGYRVYGKRAVRIDILERLADLIRPALSWRPGGEGERPAGAIEGRGFVVTPDMTSLLGAAGENFAAVLKGLGYRMEKRPASQEPSLVATPPSGSSSESSEPAATSSEEKPKTAASELPAETGDTAPTSPDKEDVADPKPNGAMEAGEETAETSEASEDGPTELKTDSGQDVEDTDQLSEPAASEPERAETASVSANEEASTEGAGGEELAASSADQTPSAKAIEDEARSAPDAAEPPENQPTSAEAASETEEAEPAMIEVWIPAGGNRHRHRGRSHVQSRDKSANGSEAQGQRQKPNRRPGGKAKDRRNGPRLGSAPPKGRQQDHNRHKAPERREKKIDPDSPFAALAQLKKDLENS